MVGMRLGARHGSGWPCRHGSSGAALVYGWARREEKKKKRDISRERGRKKVSGAVSACEI